MATRTIEGAPAPRVSANAAGAVEPKAATSVPEPKASFDPTRAAIDPGAHRIVLGNDNPFWIQPPLVQTKLFGGRVNFELGGFSVRDAYRMREQADRYRMDPVREAPPAATLLRFRF